MLSLMPPRIVPRGLGGAMPATEAPCAKMGSRRLEGLELRGKKRAFSSFAGVLGKCRSSTFRREQGREKKTRAAGVKLLRGPTGRRGRAYWNFRDGLVRSGAGQAANINQAKHLRIVFLHR